MLKEKMQQAINAQINEETFSSYLYLSMAAYFESKNLLGFANWMKVQAQEELVHVMKFYGFVNDRGGQVKLAAIAGPETEWVNSLVVFEAALKHEQHISECIHQLVDLARELKDHPTENFLQWFVAEQVEEEASADAIVQRLKLVGNDGAGLFMVDRELAARTFVMPAATAE